MKRPVRNPRTGFSLLELTVVAAMMAVLVTSVSVLLRTSQNAWEAHDSDQARLESAHAVLRHLVRHVRQGEAVTAISAPADTSGTISVLMPDAQTFVWDHSGSNVNFGAGTADSLLAEGIDELSFTGYKADGVTATTVPDEIQSVLCTAKVTLPRQTGASRTVQCWAWLRAW